MGTNRRLDGADVEVRPDLVTVDRKNAVAVEQPCALRFTAGARPTYA
jgi:hypothetical protein